jgi:HlyD family secretion protein
MKPQSPFKPLLPALGAGLLLAGCLGNSEDQMVGTLERDRLEIKTESAELITKIHVAEGQKVVAGAVIAEQDQRRLQAMLEQVQAEQQLAAARLAELQRGPRPELISEARSRLQASKVQESNARADLERARAIFERGLSNQASLDHARTTAQAATAQYQADRAALESLLNGTTAEELAQAEASVAASQARVSTAQLNLAQLVLTAPADGIVDTLPFEPGERPHVGDNIAVILADQVPYARIYVPQSIRQKVVPGTVLRVQTAEPVQDFTGTVRWVSADPSFTPYFALTEHDRSRLSYLAEVLVPGADSLPSGTPLFAFLPAAGE